MQELQPLMATKLLGSAGHRPSSTMQLLFQEDLNFEECSASYSVFFYHNVLEVESEWLVSILKVDSLPK